MRDPRLREAVPRLLAQEVMGIMGYMRRRGSVVGGLGRCVDGGGQVVRRLSWELSIGFFLVGVGWTHFKLAEDALEI